MNWLLLLILLFFVPSCSKENNEKSESAGEITKKYAKGVVEVPKKAQVITELHSIRRAIEMFKVDKERCPEELSELPIKIKYPEEYEYDHETGEVKSKHYPDL